MYPVVLLVHSSLSIVLMGWLSCFAVTSVQVVNRGLTKCQIQSKAGMQCGCVMCVSRGEWCQHGLAPWPDNAARKIVEKLCEDLLAVQLEESDAHEAVRQALKDYQKEERGQKRVKASGSGSFQLCS